MVKKLVVTDPFHRQWRVLTVINIRNPAKFIIFSFF